MLVFMCSYPFSGYEGPPGPIGTEGSKVTQSDLEIINIPRARIFLSVWFARAFASMEHDMLVDDDDGELTPSTFLALNPPPDESGIEVVDSPSTAPSRPSAVLGTSRFGTFHRSVILD